MNEVRFEMAVNDYDGLGIDTERLHAAGFDSGEFNLHLECTGREIVCKLWYDKKHIRVGRKKFPILGYGSYVGNMMWNVARVTPEVASQIANYLRLSGNYSPDNGSEALWERWETGTPLFAEVS